MPPSPPEIAASLKSRARELGFDLAAVAPASPSAYADYLRAWLAAGQASTMEWLKKRVEERANLAAYLPGARSVLCVAVNYHVPLDPPSEEESHHGRVARYALGDDYHEVLKDKLHALADHLRGLAPEAQTRACVDTAPVMEKELAQRAGLGWIGKNTCLINPHIGSWLLLGEVITTLDLPPDRPETDHCGTCTRCIDACPTQAITGPYQMDASRCISYLTIERREDIPADLQPLIGNWLYGCDVCQDVCPHNRKAPTSTLPEFQPRFRTGTLDLRDVLGWSPETYRATLKGSAMKRVKLPLLQRNARIALDNLQRKESP